MNSRKAFYLIFILLITALFFYNLAFSQEDKKPEPTVEPLLSEDSQASLEDVSGGVVSDDTAQTQEDAADNAVFSSIIPKSKDVKEGLESGKELDTTAKEAIDTGSSEQKEVLVSLDYKDAELSAVLKALAYSYGLNLVALKDIKGKVNIVLKDVTVDEALEAILTMNGYTPMRKGNIIYVSPGPSVDESGLSTVYLPLSYVSGAEAEKMLKPTLSAKGEIKVNEINNSLIVTDFTYNLDRIKKVLSEIDVAQAQVLIEAKIVDMTTKDLKNIGITVNPDYNPGHRVFSSTSGAERYNSSLTLAGPSSSLSGGQYKITNMILKGWNITATVDALIQKNKAHLLASPSIATLSGKEARIIIGQKVGYKEKTQTTTGTTETIKFVDVGTTLRVTPQVSPDGYITMTVHPEVSSLASNSADTGPTITTREADSTVRIRDGETIVIGGLIKSQNDSTVNRIPILGYIPIIGWVFSNRSADDQQTELAVFITPHIIPNTPKEKEAARELTKNKEEVFVDIEGVGERAFSAYLFTLARNLEDGSGAESLEKDEITRKSAAAEQYLRIVTAFPKSEKADISLYRAGKINFEYFRDFDKAKDIFIRLTGNYPNSPFVNSAKRYLKRIEAREAKISLKKEKGKR